MSLKMNRSDENTKSKSKCQGYQSVTGLVFCGVFLISLCEMFGIGKGALCAVLAGWLITSAVWAAACNDRYDRNVHKEFWAFLPLAMTLAVIVADLVFGGSFIKSLSGLVNCVAASRGEHLGIIVKLLENGGNEAFAAVSAAVLITSTQGVFCKLQSRGFSVIMLIAFTGLIFQFDCGAVMISAVFITGLWAIMSVNVRYNIHGLAGRAAVVLLSLLACFMLERTGAWDKLSQLLHGGFDDIDSAARYEVIMEKPQPAYLIEKRYEKCEQDSNGQWTELSNAEKYAFSDSFYWLYKGGFYPPMQTAELDDAIGISGDETAMTVSIKSGKGAVYPYGIVSAEGAAVDDRVIDCTFENEKSWYRLTVSDSYLKKPSEQSAKLSGGESVQQYLQREKGYRDYVYKTCTELSDEDRQLIENHFDLDASVGSVELEMLGFFADKVTIDKGLAYGGEDSLSRLLERELKGGEADAASAAVKIFRAKGVPARLCKGYIITDSMTEGLADNSAVEISEENSHFWAEYYRDGVGWQPFEVDPEYVGMIETDDEAVKAAVDGKAHGGGESLAPKIEETPRQEIFEENNEQKQDSILKKAAIAVAAVAVLCVIAALAALLAARVARRRLMKKPADKRVRVIFTGTVKRLCKHASAELSPHERGDHIERRFSKSLRDKYDAAERVFEKAAFSRLEITAEEEAAVTEFEAAAKKAKPKKQKGIKKGKNAPKE